jgi:hypothetical protein
MFPDTYAIGMYIDHLYGSGEMEKEEGKPGRIGG